MSRGRKVAHGLAMVAAGLLVGVLFVADGQAKHVAQISLLCLMTVVVVELIIQANRGDP